MSQLQFLKRRAFLQRSGQADGLLFWNQAAFIPKRAPNPNEAHAVLNAMCGLEYGMALTRETEYLATSSGLATALSAEDQRRYGNDLLERGLNLVPLPWPRNMDAWIEARGGVKAA